MAIYSLGDRVPQLTQPCWVADNAVVIGSVIMLPESSVFYGAVVRGDNDLITIGGGSNIQDHAMLHTDDGIQLHLGANVTVGHRAVLHGCTIGDGSLIGIGAIILNHAIIGKQSLVGANTLIPEGKSFPDRSLIIGSPGKVVRELNDEEVARIARSATHYTNQWRRHQTLAVFQD